MKVKKSFNFILATALTLGLAACSGSSESGGKNTSASNYPTKQVELIVPFAPGGGTDAVARAYADAMKNHFSEPIGVVNKTGGGGAIGFTEGINAKADGYKATLITGDFAILPNMGLVSFNKDDLKTVAQLNADPSAITVSADAPWDTVEEFLEDAQKNPEKIRIGNAGTGSIWHLSAAALEDVAGTKFSHIPYDGAAPAVTALLGGHLEAVTVSPAEVSAHIDSGKLKMLAIMTDERLDKYKDVPTLKESGVDLSVGTWRGVGVPKDTPQEIVDILTEASKKAVEEETFINVLDKMNLGLIYKDDKGFREVIDNDYELFSSLIAKSNIKQQ
ncbi:tripartite tricarboxylate transporter substrate binding protein [Cytobacillus depressus]|uniref:Tripartite tricarboxylate transporter substrate binding protein n=1 Tax=Cytobacillus depressus TaxID=1602942 RepID=A0A6L3UYT7_9BACI|nr:tripartite tricarboxylate transporter substrate binding protein [Cytobacillus depressus]KAB2329565.1 tripartite tricarboxylate transporter substrate binding protein [Cytobacillus depressus]